VSLGSNGLPFYNRSISSMEVLNGIESLSQDLIMGYHHNTPILAQLD
jgi:hypothetical protein